MIVDDFEKGGMKRQWSAEVEERLKKAKRYLKTDFRVHCNPEEAVCPDHCRKLALDDEQDLDLRENCSRQHTENCKECQNLRNVLDKVEDKIRGPSWRPYSSEQRDDLLYDFKLAKTDILQWKALIVRSINQEVAKQDQLKMTSTSQDCALVIMECQQDWFAVCSIIEKEIKTKKPHITRVYIRSDEAGCYHNNSLIAAARDIGQRAGIEVFRYDLPQYGKDVCDRILCPVKTCIRRFCNEGHDILTAGDTRTALCERPVKGTSACVCEVNESKRTLEVNKIDGFSKLHNIQFGEKSIPAWWSYEIGRGKEISYDQLVLNDQGDTALVVSKEFFPFHNARVYEYTVPGTEGQMKTMIWTIQRWTCFNVWSLDA
ncbi:hypothetical protein AWC38_SpisGene24698 [Stylophora pistillata]|uniref:Uncharacterized protein n=1 Tax=Stylophora pistillata TaxID=50429 RepID=A0A2B4R575_STYPI|nr:hypothetical protein AWC38_SpisGene24698 [Stylophora pistillata]